MMPKNIQTIVIKENITKKLLQLQKRSKDKFITNVSFKKNNIKKTTLTYYYFRGLIYLFYVGPKSAWTCLTIGTNQLI